MQHQMQIVNLSRFAYFAQVDGRNVACLTLWTGDVPQIGYITNSRERGQGYATALLKAALPTIPRYYRRLVINADNKPSIRVAEKCGFYVVSRHAGQIIYEHD